MPLLDVLLQVSCWPLKYCKTPLGSPWSVYFSRMSNSLSLSSAGEVLCPSEHLHGLLWTCFAPTGPCNFCVFLWWKGICLNNSCCTTPGEWKFINSFLLFADYGTCDIDMKWVTVIGPNKQLSQFNNTFLEYYEKARKTASMEFHASSVY